MDLLAEAPALPVLLSLCLCFPSLQGTFPLFAGISAFFLSAGIVAVLSIRWDRRRCAMAVMVTAISFVLAFCCSLRLFREAPSASLTSRGLVILERRWGRGRVMIVDTRKGRFLTKVPAIRSFPEGTDVSFAGDIVPIRGAKEGKGFDERRYWMARGVSGELIAGDLKKVGTSFSLSSLRFFLKRRILLSLPPLTRGYLLAAVLGGRDPDLAEAHKRWGTAHLLAVSGFHVGIVAAMAWFLFRRVRMSWLAVSIAVWCYVLIAGGAASSVRAALMVQTAAIGLALGRPSSGVNSVALAALALLVWRPWWFWDLGWRLSVSCALVVTAVASTKGIGPWKRFFVMSPLLWAVTAPMIADAFGSVSVNGLILNLIALPVFSVLLPISLVFSVPALLGLPGGVFFAMVPEGAFSMWSMGADAISLGYIGWNPWLPVIGAVVMAMVMTLRFRIPLCRGGLLFLILTFFESLTANFL